MSFIQKEVKVVLLGDSGVGKSSILLRFCSNDFKESNDPTLGAAFMSKVINVDNQSIKFQIWDTAGQEKYKSLTPLYYRGNYYLEFNQNKPQDAQIALIVYDISNRQSFEVLKNWVMDLKQHGPKKLIQVLVGNKQDLIESEVVSYDEASNYAKSIDAKLKLTSCKENKGVYEMFQNIAEQFIMEETRKSGANKTNQEQSVIKINTKQVNKQQSSQSKCC